VGGYNLLEIAPENSFGLTLMADIPGRLEF